MKVAITSTGNSPESILDQRFGRCRYFVFYDTVSRETEFIPNPHRDHEERTGQSSVQLMRSNAVQKIVSGEFGIRIKPLLDSLKISMIVMKEPGKKIREIVELLNH